MNIIIASSNNHKINEIKSMLPDGHTLQGLKDIGFNAEIPETGNTIAENSLIKARFILEHGNIPTNSLIIADDSGLEVKALNGAPGVYSARYAGTHGNDELNNKKLINELSKVTNRAARFVTVISLIKEGREYSFEGEITGTIAYEPRGSAGFGYDPLFIPTGYRSTFAELGEEIKNKISHRKQAISKFLDFLKKN